MYGQKWKVILDCSRKTDEEVVEQVLSLSHDSGVVHVVLIGLGLLVLGGLLSTGF